MSSSENTALLSQIHLSYKGPESTDGPYRDLMLGTSSAISRIFHKHTPMVYSTRSVTQPISVNGITSIPCNPPADGQTRFLKSFRLALNLPAIYAFPSTSVPSSATNIAFATWCNDVMARALKSLRVRIVQSGEHGLVLVDELSGMAGAWVHFQHCKLDGDERYDQGIFRSLEECLNFSCSEHQVYVDIDVPFIRTDANMKVEVNVEWNNPADFVNVISGAVNGTRRTEGSNGLGSFPVLQPYAEYHGVLPFVAEKDKQMRGTDSHFRRLTSNDITYMLSVTYANIAVSNIKAFPEKGNQSIIRNVYVDKVKIPLSSTTRAKFDLSLPTYATTKCIRAFGVYSLTELPSYGISYLASGCGFDIGTSVNGAKNYLGQSQNTTGPNDIFNKLCCETPILVSNDTNSANNGNRLLTYDESSIGQPTALYVNTFTSNSVSRFPALKALYINTGSVVGSPVPSVPGMIQYDVCNEDQTIGVNLLANVDMVVEADDRISRSAQKDVFPRLSTTGVQLAIASGMSDNPRMRDHYLTVYVGIDYEQRVIQMNDNSLAMAVIP